MEVTTKTVSFAGVEFSVCGDVADPYFANIDGFMGDNTLHVAALRSLPDDAVIIDVGANIGATVALAGALLPRCTITAVEPGRATRVCLEATIAANGLQDRVQVIAKCVGALPGEVRFAQSPGSMSASHIWNQPTGGEAVEMTTLTALAENLLRLDFVKIDVEGWELDVIEGGAWALERHKPLVLAEMNSWALNAIRNISPRQLLDHIRETYGPIMLLGDEGFEVANSINDCHTALHRNIFQRSCVDDILFSPLPGLIERLSRQSAEMEIPQ